MQKIHILGVAIDLLTIEQLNEIITRCIEADQRQIIANHNLHSIYLYHKHQKFRSLYAIADFIQIDGMSLIFWAKLLGYRVRSTQRVAYIDWIPSLMSQFALKGWKVFYLGSQTRFVNQGARILAQRCPGLQIMTHHGYFNSTAGHTENEEVIRTINEFGPHLLMVGMGMPRQEQWVRDNHSRLDLNVIVTCGSYIDYVAGVVPTPPRWLGRVGFEWLFRLLTQSRYLWRRYLIEPWFLLPWVITDIKNHVSRPSSR